MGECSKTWQRWIPPLTVMMMAAPMWLRSAGAETDDLFDSHAAAHAPVAVAGAEVSAADDDVQPLRVHRRRAIPPQATTTEVPLAEEVRPRSARQEPQAAAVAADPEALPASPPIADVEPTRRPTRQTRVEPTAPEAPVVAVAEPPAPQFVRNGSRADRGIDGTYAMVREVPRSYDSRSYRSGDPRSVRIIQNYADQIDVPAGQSAIVRLNRPAERVAIADPEVADVVLVNPTEILINGRGRRHQAQSGETIIEEAQTSIIVWDKQGRSDLRELYVNRSRTEQVELRVTMAEFNIAGA